MSGIVNPELILSLSTIGISIGIALVGSVLLTAWIGWELDFSPEGKMWTFILGFALLGGLVVAATAHDHGWNEKFFFYYYGLLSALVILVYFVPTAAAAASSHPSEQAIFILNLFFGWTLVGWLVALGWAISHPRAERPTYRITPFGAVPARPPAGLRR